MKKAEKLLIWAALLAGTACLFYRFGATDAQALTDQRTSLTVLTDTGTAVLTMAEYLPHAVAAEMPVSFGPEALKAQAVAARTYALAARRHGQAQVCLSNAGCCISWQDEPYLRQHWGADYEKNWAAVVAAVTATDGEYLTYGGQAIQAVFHASSAGKTENSGALWSPLPYLVSVSTPETAEDVPGLVTTVVLSAGELAGALGLDTDGDPAGWLGPVTLDEAGRVASVTVRGQAFSGEELRSVFGLRSTAFTLRWDGSAFVFTVSGYGHGVGMSQYGARAYAAQGWSYRQILAHYYPGTALSVYAP